MGVLLWPGAFGLVVGLLPHKAAWVLFVFGLVAYFLFFSSAAGSAVDGAGWGLFVGIFLALPFLVGLVAGVILKFTVKAFR